MNVGQGNKVPFQNFFPKTQFILTTRLIRDRQGEESDHRRPGGGTPCRLAIPPRKGIVAARSMSGVKALLAPPAIRTPADTPATGRADCVISRVSQAWAAPQARRFNGPSSTQENNADRQAMQESRNLDRGLRHTAPRKPSSMGCDTKTRQTGRKHHGRPILTFSTDQPESVKIL